MKKKRNIIKVMSLIIVASVLISCIPATVSATAITPSAPEAGDGSAASPYEISNAGELYWFAGLVNGTLADVAQNTDAYAVLTADITVNEKVLENGELIEDTASLVPWIPIGNSDYYEGEFDGKGYTIKGLYCSGSSIGGLFGITRNTIRNIKIADSYFESPNYAGGICGSLQSRIYNCSVSAKVVAKYDHAGGIAGSSTSEIRYCEFTGSVSGTDYVGGICGECNANMRDCNNKGTVTGNRYVGGLAGSLWGSYSWEGTNRNYNIGKVSGVQYVGGLFGELGIGTDVFNCYNTGRVTATDTYAGGLCGYLATDDYFSTCAVSYCYNSGKVHAKTYSGCVFGMNNGVMADDIYYLEGTATDSGGYEQKAFGKSSVGPGGGYSTYIKEITDTDLASGAIAYFLQSVQDSDDIVWGQMGKGPGFTPVLTNNKAYAVKKYTDSQGLSIYMPGGVGDLNGDEVLDGSDYEAIIKTALGETTEEGAADIADDEVFGKTDMNGDGVIDVLDVALLERNIT